MPEAFSNLRQFKVSEILQASRKGVTNSRRVDLGVRGVVAGGSIGGIDTTVDDDVGDVNALGAELAGQALSESALRKLAGRENAEAGGAPERRGGARHQETGRVRRGVDRLEEQRQGALGKVVQTATISRSVYVVMSGEYTGTYGLAARLDCSSSAEDSRTGAPERAGPLSEACDYGSVNTVSVPPRAV